MKTKDKYIGTMLGTAIGDTFGMPIETWTKERIKKYLGRVSEPIAPFVLKDAKGNVLLEDEFGKIKYFARDLKKGDWTDDTILAVALGDSLVEHGINLEEIAKGQLNAYHKSLNPNNTDSHGFGKTTMEAFRNLAEGKSPYESGIIGGPGTGPAMKMAPLGLYAYSKGNLEGALDFAEDIGRITHLDPRSIVAGVLQTQAVYSLIDDISNKEDFMDLMIETCKKYENPLDERFTWHKSGNILSKLEWIKENMDESDEEAHNVLGSTSAVYKAYPFTLFMLQKYWNQPLEGLIETVNFGGDCDTTGAMYGALAGANHGAWIFPREWTDALKDKHELIRVGEDLYGLGGGRNYYENRR